MDPIDIPRIEARILEMYARHFRPVRVTKVQDFYGVGAECELCHSNTLPRIMALTMLGNAEFPVILCRDTDSCENRIAAVEFKMAVRDGNS